MNQDVRTQLNRVDSTDRPLQNEAYSALMAETEQPVDWTYEAWDELVALLRHKDNHQRAIAAQLLCNLAKSDPEQRILKDFDALFAVSRDERFVTARHCMQSLWKVGAAGEPQKQKLVENLAARYAECITEKNGTLIRYDSIESLRNLYDATQDQQVKEKALHLIETEEDPKYRKKYATLWKTR